MKNDNLFSIGEFARLCGVKKDTMFHYDKIGILKPEVTADNGYRYYSHRQFFTFDIIACLKECGTPLKEIKSYIDHQDTEYFLKILEDKERALKEEQDKIERMRRVLKNTVSMTKKALSVEAGVCWLEECEEEHMLVTEKLFIKEKSMADRMNLIDRLFNAIEETKMQEEFPICSIVLKEHLLEGEFTEDYYFCKISGPADHPQYAKKPAGTYAFIYHVGSYQALPESYRKLIRFIREHDYEIVGNSYEHEMMNHLAVKDPEKYVLKISIKVEKTAL